jgi:hypothetical protein
MKRLALLGVLVGASLAAASIAPRQTEFRPYAGLNTPADATTAAAGGLGVAATDEVKARTRMLYEGGGPCGSPRPSDDYPPRSAAGGGADETNIWLPVGLGVTAVASIALVGFVLLRRSRV